MVFHSNCYSAELLNCISHLQLNTTIMRFRRAIYQLPLFWLFWMIGLPYTGYWLAVIKHLLLRGVSVYLTVLLSRRCEWLPISWYKVTMFDGKQSHARITIKKRFTINVGNLNSWRSGHGVDVRLPMCNNNMRLCSCLFFPMLSDLTFQLATQKANKAAKNKEKTLTNVNWTDRYKRSIESQTVRCAR